MNANFHSRRKSQETRRVALVCGVSAVVCGLILAGCAGQRGQTLTLVETEPVCFADLEKAAAMQAAEDVLAKMHFVIEKADADAGLIRTRPLTGAQFFEFWRTDSAGGFNAAEANLHSIRRTVELHIRKQDNGFCIGCDVKTERLNLPELEVSSSARAYAMFSRSSSSLQKMQLNPEQEEGIAWVDLGKDSRLATRILERIEKQISELAKED
ncbi:MAG: hypothetical protein KAY65_10845 [Planctomycetes bacterium]|nr:hypothetical protein [Planctomycetota bacterium]